MSEHAVAFPDWGVGAPALGPPRRRREGWHLSAVAGPRCRGMSVRPASHHVEGDADVLLGDLFWGEGAVGPPPRRQRRAHGDDGAGGHLGVVGAEPAVAHGVLHLVV